MSVAYNNCFRQVAVVVAHPLVALRLAAAARVEVRRQVVVRRLAAVRLRVVLREVADRLLQAPVERRRHLRLRLCLRAYTAQALLSKSTSVGCLAQTSTIRK